MKKQNNWFDKLFFPGAEVLYPLLSLVCLFFFFFFFGEDKQYTTPILKGQSPNWNNWYIFAILGFIFCSLWGMIHKWWGHSFLVIGTVVLFFSFIAIQMKVFDEPEDTFTLRCVISCYAILYCIILAKWMQKMKFLLVWLILIFIVWTVFGNILLTILSCLITLIFIAILDSSDRPKNLKLFVSIGICVFYCLTTFTYFPCNPLLFSINNVKKISAISLHPKTTTLVVEKDGKYTMVNGTSFCGDKVINAEFDYYEARPDMYFCVGFSTNIYKDAECDSLMVGCKVPMDFSDSCVYFMAVADLYSFLDKQKESGKACDSLTANIFYDFIELYNNNDAISLNRLKKHQRDLQTKLDMAALDTLGFKSKESNNEKILKDFARNLSLGMLNALCSDLVHNNDINSALRIFSYQFYLTFCSISIYSKFIQNFNVNINIRKDDKLISSNSFQLTGIDLLREDTFEYWTKMLTMSIAFARLYIEEIQNDINKPLLPILKEIEPLPLNSDKIQRLKNAIEEIILLNSTYPSTPAIKQYATAVQKFLYQCVRKDYLPDYNSFFLNRFNEFSPMVPMYSESIAAYDSISSLYTARFNRDRDAINTLHKYRSVLEHNIRLQDSIDNILNSLGLSPNLKRMIQEKCLEAAKSK